MLVIITGGSSGLGAALVARAPEGAQVVSLSRSPGVATQHGAVHAPVDLATREGLDAAARVIVDLVAASTERRIVCIHNAGVLDPVGFAGEIDLAAATDLAIVDAVAPQVVGGAFVEAALAGTARAQLLQITSGAARTPYPGWAGYCAAKAAVDMWTRAVGQERTMRGDDRVRVFAVAPGVVATAMQEQIRATDVLDFPLVGKFRALHADDALADPDDVARELWRLLDLADTGVVQQGAVLDIRDLSEELRA